MPAGTSTGRYIIFGISSLISMMTGSQIVHMHYKPLQDLDVYIQREINSLPIELQQAVKGKMSKNGT